MKKIAVNVSEAVEITGIGRTNLYHLFKTGALKPRKLGKRTLIIVEELEAYIKTLPAAA